MHSEPREIQPLIEAAGVYALGQKLVGIPVVDFAWGGDDAVLSIGMHEGLSRACATAYAPPPDRCQLDLFHDSNAMLLEDKICEALADRHPDRAREQVARLMRQESMHPSLRGFLRLIQSIDPRSGSSSAQSAVNR